MELWDGSCWKEKERADFGRRLRDFLGVRSECGNGKALCYLGSTNEGEVYCHSVGEATSDYVRRWQQHDSQVVESDRVGSRRSHPRGCVDMLSKPECRKAIGGLYLNG